MKRSDLLPEIPKPKKLDFQLVIVGGGLAGTCTAIYAAREGVSVALVQDRPVLGGNSSSEVRLWALGATSHMGNNNRWAREGGIIDEIMVENLYRNPEGNPVLFDVLLLDKVNNEKNISLFLNTAVKDAKIEMQKIISIEAFCSQNSTSYYFSAPLFVDASGDGILGYISGAAFRVGAEGFTEFNEGLASDSEDGELLGQTIYFYSKDTGKPVKYIPPDFALKDITTIPRYQDIRAGDYGCSFWWLEYGGRKDDPVSETENIKWELWKVVYGVWDYIKNSGRFPEAENSTLEWVGLIPGKRESRRFEGEYMLFQDDIVKQHRFDDAVSFGGWAIDLHPADGVYSELPPCTQFHSKGVYQIPYRCFYSRNVNNLFLAGRLISASHVAFGSTRVMMTGSHNGQVVGAAAALCLEHQINPSDIYRNGLVGELQKQLLRNGQFIPHVEVYDNEDLAKEADITVSSTKILYSMKPNGKKELLMEPTCMLLPLFTGEIPELGIYLSSENSVDVCFQLRLSSRIGNTTPDIIVEEKTINISSKKFKEYRVNFNYKLDEEQYVFLCLLPAPGVSINLTGQRLPGILRLFNRQNKKVSKGSKQEPPSGSCIESFEFWLPERRPNGLNWAMNFYPGLELYSKDYLNNGFERPFLSTNSWVPSENDQNPQADLFWSEQIEINRIIISLDTDFDHPMESVQFGHPERVTPFCVENLIIKDDQEQIVFSIQKNHQTRIDIKLEQTIKTQKLSLSFLHSGSFPVAVYRIRVF